MLFFSSREVPLVEYAGADPHAYVRLLLLLEMNGRLALMNG